MQSFFASWGTTGFSRRVELINLSLLILKEFRHSTVNYIPGALRNTAACVHTAVSSQYLPTAALYTTCKTDWRECVDCIGYLRIRHRYFCVNAARLLSGRVLRHVAMHSLSRREASSCVSIQFHFIRCVKNVCEVLAELQAAVNVQWDCKEPVTCVYRTLGLQRVCEMELWNSWPYRYSWYII
jgi:hypothetical protein